MSFRSLLKAGTGMRGYGRVAALVTLCLLIVVLVVPASALAKGSYGASITLKALSPTVKAGATVSLTAKVRPAEGSVTFQAHGAGGAWADVATKAVPVSGLVKLDVKPLRHTWYRAIWTRDSGATVKSNTVWVKVFAIVNVYAEPGVYATGAGTPIMIHGMVIPKSPDGQVWINIMYGTTTVAHLPVDLTAGPGDASSFSATFNAMAPGTYIIKARVGRTADFFGANGFTSITL